MVIRSKLQFSSENAYISVPTFLNSDMMHPFDFIKLIIWLCGPTLLAQNAVPDYNFHTIKESSSQRAVSSFVQDSTGLIWMGTNGVGLSRFSCNTDYCDNADRIGKF